MTVPQPSWRRSARDGHPFGGSVLVLRSVPSRLDAELACTIEDGQGRPVGSIRSAGTGGWQAVAQFLGGGTAASWDFVIAHADGRPYLHIRRPRVRGWRDRHERFEIRDPGGRDIGRLLQNNSFLAGIRTFTLESGPTTLGHTTFDYERTHGAFGQITARTVTIHDSGGRTVAGVVQRRTTAQFFGNDFYDYTLTFDYPPYEPLGSLCLAVLLSEYFYRRTERGGTLRGIPGV